MPRPIVSDENKFDGALHIEGTDVTIDEVQAFWRQPGIGAREARARFHQLTEAELGAAVTYSPPSEPIYEYVAEVEGPPRLRLQICSEQRGWMFFVTEIASDGSEHLSRDTWDESWEQILLYPETYAPREVEWRERRSCKVVDIYAINPDQVG